MPRRKHRSKKITIAPYQVDITALTPEGRGVATLQGKKKFLRKGLPGETVMATDTYKHNSYDEGEVLEVLAPSPERVTPLCIHAQLCGGCVLQHFDPLAQIRFKEEMLMMHLLHIAELRPAQTLPPLLGAVFGYRHKARLGVKYVGKKEKVLVGFRESNGRYLADIDSCVVLHPAIGQKITALSKMIHTLEAYQSIPQIEAAVGEGVTALVFRHLQPLSAGDTAKLVQFAEDHSDTTQQMHLYLQPGGMDSIKRLWPETGEELLQYTLPAHNLTLQFHPANFTQINPEINRKMVDQAIALLAPQAHERILDLFCGLGNFTLPLARHCKEIIGVEGEHSLVARAVSNAHLNSISNAHFHTADLAADFSSAAFMEKPFDKILLDPPRTGALEAVKLLPQFKPERIVYVSCNPATLARDAKELTARGYVLTQAGVMDMFPHTGHVESMALFERKG
jgi:23S rRNA (uracil1939-C5)-methyltransferase